MVLKTKILLQNGSQQMDQKKYSDAMTNFYEMKEKLNI